VEEKTQHQVEANDSILQKISQLYAQMSSSQQLIADVILKDPETAAFYNVNQLAKQAGVSDSTVTRFATFVGCSGFPALSRELQGVVRSRLTTGDRFQRTLQLDNDAHRAAMQAFEDDLNNVQMMTENLDWDTFERVVNELASAKRIALVCSRSTASLGLYVEFYLNLLQKEVILFTGDPRNLDLLQRLGPDDVMVGIGFSRYVAFTVDCLQYAQKRQVKTIAITDYHSSPLVPFGDLVLYTPTGIASYMESLAAALSLLSALLRVLTTRISGSVTESLSQLEEVWSHFDLYSRLGQRNNE
jgi:DNA-binding MurR/RpiR family transcriptional regulator